MKLSIVTINYNNAEGLRRTLESVAAQTNHEIEHVIVDGASTDKSVEVIKDYVQQLEIGGWNLENVKWTSEPDAGIYSAMNKGIEIAAGKRIVNSFNRSELVEDKNKGNEENYVLMLNSGDYFVDEHVVARVLPELDGTDIIQGNVIAITEGKEVVKKGYGRSELTFIDVMKGQFLHQASFCRRELFDRYGYFDESYKINGDTVFYAKCLGFGNATFKYINQNIAYFDMTGISADPEGKYRQLRKDEDNRYAQMFSKRMWDLFYNEEKKMRLYDKLHAHKLSWYLTMLIAKMTK